MDTPVTIVILAAGLGTRMKSKKAKVLHQVGGKPLVEHVVESALEVTSAERIFVVVGRQAEQVRAALASYGVGFIEQKEQKGTGHALRVCRECLEPLSGLLAVLYGDCPLLAPATLRELIHRQSASTSAATVMTTVPPDSTGYGRIVRDEQGGVQAIVEQKAATQRQLALREINAGIYCFRSELLWAHIGSVQPDNPAREYYLTDMVEILRRAGHTVQPFLVQDYRQLLGINSRAELAEVDRILRDSKVKELMLAGVTIEKPETVTIDMAVRIGRDTVVEPFTRILGRTSIGEDCRVGAFTILRDCELEDGVEVCPYTIAESSRVASGARLGPYARLRMGSQVGVNARVGNFVELKNTRMSAGAKANHLAYLGDTAIGEEANIGAGTITCNYDGVKKHQTRIGDRAFVGSNATLVAPIEIGDGGYVAAGSVITKDVPPDALGIGRGTQVIKEGWAKKRREKRD